jgi:dihydroflavonol-4-reductase
MEQSTLKTAFVTGGTGLLGSNLTRLLLARGVRVRALVRSVERAQRLIGDTQAELVVGDLADPASYRAALRGVDVVFHTAAYFRDSYKGGGHNEGLHRINVQGTRDLIEEAYAQGVRRFVHTSSIAVLEARASALEMDETMTRALARAPDDYYRSKILADAEVHAALARHPDLTASLVLPGFMNGPGDAGPTSAGQLVLDFLRGKLPGALNIAFSYVDARDVAEAQIAAAERGRRGERYLAAGRPYKLRDALMVLAGVAGVAGPSRTLPDWLFGVVALLSEAWHRLSGRPVLTSWTGFRTALRERDNVRFASAKSERELGITFRPLEQTFADALAWYQQHGHLPGSQNETEPPSSDRPRKSTTPASASSSNRTSTTSRPRQPPTPRPIGVRSRCGNVRGVR